VHVPPAPPNGVPKPAPSQAPAPRSFPQPRLRMRRLASRIGEEVPFKRTGKPHRCSQIPRAPRQAADTAVGFRPHRDSRRAL
jgi:hypothetical protein